MDGSAVTLAGSHATNNVLVLTLTGAGTGNMIDIQNDTSGSAGYDIIGTGDTWSVSSAGAAVFTAITGCDTLTAAANLAIDATGAGTITLAGTSTGAITLTTAVTATASITITGSAEAEVLTVTAGDVKITAGLLTLDDDDTATGNLLIPSSTATSGNVVSITADDLTSGAALFIDSDNGASFSGNGGFIHISDGTNPVFKVGRYGALTIAGNAAGTASLTLTTGELVLDDADGSKFESEDGTGTLLTLDNVAGVIADNKAVLLVDAGGAVASGGNALRVIFSGAAAAGAILAEFLPDAGSLGVKIDGGGLATNVALYVDADPTAVDVVYLHSDAVIASDKAVLNITSAGAIASGGNGMRLDITGTPASGAIYCEFDFAGLTDTNENIGLLIDAGGKKVRALYVDADPVAEDVVYMHSDAVLASDKAVLNITSAGAVASGGNVLRIDVTGTPASGAIYTEFDFAGLTDTNENVGVLIDATAKKVQALKINAAPVAGSTILATSTGALAADKATCELVSDVSACNGDSAVLRVEQTHTTGVATCLALKQDDVDIPFITFETTIGTGAAIEAVGAKTLTTTHFVAVDIEGVGTRYFPVGTIA